MSDVPALQQRLGKRSFAGWDGALPPGLVAQSEDAVGKLIERLIALGLTPRREQVQSEIDECVRRFNELDASCEQSWICTIEREDIGEVLWELVDLCGFDASEEWLSEREW